jgi:aminoglycoside 6'-N-acetyltransferase I
MRREPDLMNSGEEIRIERCTRRSLAEWTAFRHALWPQAEEQELRLEAEALLGNSRQAIAFLARVPEGTAVAFAEATLRHGYVNGCTTSPVAFLEGIYVRSDHRKRGIARLLCKAVEDWAVDLGCSELASDTELHNTGSQRMHGALGFEEMERVVCYRKQLSPSRRPLSR